MSKDINGLEKTFLEVHCGQLQASGVPAHFWKTLFIKLQGEVYDAGEKFQLCRVEFEDDENNSEETEPSWQWQVLVTASEGIKASEPNSIFLIDHAWSYEASQASHMLRSYPGLSTRMAALMDLEEDSKSEDQLISDILTKMWKFNGTYTIGGSTPGTEPVWYILDEFGSRIQHSDFPNFRLVPFYYSHNQCCYTLMFPTQDVEEGEEVTRNYVEGPPVSEETREVLLLPWLPQDFTSVSCEQPEPPSEFFTTERANEILPDVITDPEPLPLDRQIKVFSEYDFINEYLTDKRFQIVPTPEEADIRWLLSHFKDFRALQESHPNCRLNQFPCEHILTVKDLLAIVCRRAVPKTDAETPYPVWLPITFCLKRELSQFVSCFQKREKKGEDNHWIIKPWNLARNMGHTITSNIDHILRLPATGPKIAQKYIENPVLYYRKDIDTSVKFDLRFIVLLLSVKPLKVAIYRRFWIRFANEKFNLEDCNNLQRHMTVNNYNDAPLLQMYCDKFISSMEEQYPDHPWSETEKRIEEMVKEMFQAATSLPPPSGIGHNLRSKASFGIDVMLEWHKINGESIMQPKLLEVNFNPDCKRACEYYNEFFNDLFSVMYLDDYEGHNVAILDG